MQADFRPARHAWLIVIALGHVAVPMAWRPIARQDIDAATHPDGELVFLSLPPSSPSQPAQHARQPATPPAPAPVASSVARPDAPPEASDEASQTITLPAHAGLPGRSMLRGKIVCEEVDHIGVGGRDPFRSGSTARYVRCPK